MEQLGEWDGLSLDGDRPEWEIEFEAKLPDRRSDWLGEEFDDARSLRGDRACCDAGSMIAEGGQGEAATAAELGLAQIAAVEGVEDLAPLAGTAVAGHPETSRGSRKTADGAGRTLTVDCRIRLIQCDGYSAYEALSKRYAEIRLGACLAHIRRKFFEAREQSPRVTDAILKFIGKLYVVEASMRAGPRRPDLCRVLIRTGYAGPHLRQLKEKILSEHGRHLPKSKLGEALDYALGQWEQLERYLIEGRLDIDNNAVENLIRPAKLGLKNWLCVSRKEVDDVKQAA